MRLIKVCPTCLLSYPDITQNFCTVDGTQLSEAFPIPLKEDDQEIETVIRPTTSDASTNTSDRARAKAKPFILKNYPELARYKIRSSRMWEEPDYRPCWWFGLMESDLQTNEFFIFAGALDRVNRDFKLFKVPSSYIRDNLSKLDKTAAGWINIYLHTRELTDVRNEAHLSFKQFAVN